MLCTSSDNVIRQRETETPHASDFQHFLYSRPIGLGLLVEILTSGAEHHAGILADVRDIAFDALEVLPLLHRSNLFSGFPMSRQRHFSSHSTK